MRFDNFPSWIYQYFHFCIIIRYMVLLRFNGTIRHQIKNNHSSPNKKSSLDFKILIKIYYIT